MMTDGCTARKWDMMLGREASWLVGVQLGREK